MEQNCADLMRNKPNNKNIVKCENVVRELFLIRIVLILLYAVFKSENMY